MAHQATHPVKAERNVHLLLLGAVGAAFLVAGAFTKNERAVFLTEGTGLPAKAFAAMIPPARAFGGREPLLVGRTFSRSDLNDLASGRPTRRPGGPTNAGLIPNPNFVVPSAPLSGPGAPAATTLSNATPDSAPLQVAALSPSQFVPSVPQPIAGGAGGTGGSNTGGDGTGTPTTPTNPTTPVDPTTPTSPATPTSPTTPTPPVAAVPEPATWAMLLLGFLAVGVAARRKRAASPVAGISA